MVKPIVENVALVLNRQLDGFQVVVDHRIDDAIIVSGDWDGEGDVFTVVLGYEDGEWDFVKDYDFGLQDEQIAQLVDLANAVEVDLGDGGIYRIM